MIKINKNISFSYKKPPVIVAEISGNHNGSKKRFLNLIKQACISGADLIKIQTYEPKDITVKSKLSAFRIKKGVWKNKYLWDLYKKACTPFEWHKEAFRIAKRYKKILFSSPFSIRAVDLLESYNVTCYKLASFEITDVNLINYIASKKKPIIISTGVASFKDIDNAIKIIRKYHNKIIILHCVSNYPTQLEDVNFKNIVMLKRKYKKFLIGISDHTDNIYSSMVSMSYGVVLIEKHFNYDKKKTPDSLFSINSEQLHELKKNSLKLYSGLNMKGKKSKISLNFKRSIFAAKFIKKNDVLSSENIKTARPSVGISAENYFKILGKKINKNIKKNNPIYFRNLIK